jgi:NAD(P)-dependent dehydrogenase (short-subunit alcohol dehydrogenase family)
MIEQKYGRILMTTSSSGLYGNFGQSNYGAAKLALVGLMQTLSIEGAKYGIHVNSLAPTAATRMTEDLMSQAVLDALKPEAVVPAMLVLVSEQAPSRTILCAGAGNVEAAHISLTQGSWVGLDGQSPERLAEHLSQVLNREGDMVPQSGAAQGAHEVGRAVLHLANT